MKDESAIDRGDRLSGVPGAAWRLVARWNPPRCNCRSLLGNWGEVWASRPVQLVDFRDRSANSLVNRCPRMEWFEGIVGNAEKATVYDPRPVMSAEKADAWLHRQVRPMLAAMTARYGGSVKYVEGLMKEGEPRWKTKHHLLADGKL